jgi:hypothetical protein
MECGDALGLPKFDGETSPHPSPALSDLSNYLDFTALEQAHEAVAMIATQASSPPLLTHDMYGWDAEWSRRFN